MAMNATRQVSGQNMLTPLAKAIFLVLGLLAVGSLAVVADTNPQLLRGGFAGHAAASQVSQGIAALPADAQGGGVVGNGKSATAKWDVDPYANPAAKIADPIATF